MDTPTYSRAELLTDLNLLACIHTHSRRFCLFGIGMEFTSVASLFGIFLIYYRLFGWRCEGCLCELPSLQGSTIKQSHLVSV